MIIGKPFRYLGWIWLDSIIAIEALLLTPCLHHALSRWMKILEVGKVESISFNNGKEALCNILLLLEEMEKVNNWLQL